MSNEVVGDPHVVAAIVALSAVENMLKILPPGDIVLQSGELAHRAIEILVDYCEDKEIPVDDLYRFLEETDEIREEIKRIYAASKR